MSTVVTPAATVQQEYQAVSTGTLKPQLPCIIGPHFKVFDVDDTEDREIINFGSYVPGVDTDYSYKELPAGAKVDLNSLALRLESILAKFATLSGSNVIERGSQANYIKIATGNGFQDYTNSAGSSFARNSVFKLRDVQIGDRVKIVANSKTLKSRIVGFVHDTVAASVGTPSASANPSTRSYSGSVVETDDKSTDHVPTINTATTSYIGDITKGIINDVYVLECIEAGAPETAKFKVTSNTGDNVLSVTSVAFGTAFDVGTRGLRAQIASSGSEDFIVGEKYTFTVAAAYTNGAPTLTSGSTVYNGLYDTAYTIEVIKGGTWAEKPQVIVKTSTGIDAAGPQVVDHDVSFNVGTLGVAVKFANEFAATQGGLVLGDTYTIAVTASAKGAIKTAVLANPIDSSIAEGDDLTVDFYIYKESMDIPTKGYPYFGSTNLLATADTITVAAGIVVQDSSWLELDGETLGDLSVEEATVYIGYRALLTDKVGILQSLSDLSSVGAVFGKVNSKNPIGLGVNNVLLNSAGQTCYFITVGSDDLAGYQAALEVLETDPTPYFRLVMSSDPAILDLLKAHVKAQSATEVGNRCMGIVASDFPTSVTKYDKKSNGDNWTGYVAVEPGSSPAIYTRLNVAGATFVTDGIRAGDELRTLFGADAFGNETYSSVLIDSVIDEENIILVSPGFSAAVGSSGNPQRIQIIRALTQDEQAIEAKKLSESFADSKVVNVFPDIPLDDAEYYLAAAIAGLACSVVPHQPITEYAITGYSSQKATKKRFTETQLNVIASGGTLIVTREIGSGTVFIRHQITTDVSDIRKSEFSMVRNYDSIADYVLQGFKSFKGKWNQHENFFQILDTQLRHRFNYLVNTSVTETAGPQLKSWNSASLKIAQNPVLKTAVDMEAEVEMPYPANQLKLKLTAIA